MPALRVQIPQVTTCAEKARTGEGAEAPKPAPQPEAETQKAPAPAPADGEKAEGGEETPAAEGGEKSAEGYVKSNFFSNFWLIFGKL